MSQVAKPRCEQASHHVTDFNSKPKRYQCRKKAVISIDGRTYCRHHDAQRTRHYHGLAVPVQP